MSTNLIATLVADTLAFVAGMCVALLLFVQFMGMIVAKVIERLIAEGYISKGQRYAAKEPNDAV